MVAPNNILHITIPSMRNLHDVDVNLLLPTLPVIVMNLLRARSIWTAPHVMMTIGLIASNGLAITPTVGSKLPTSFWKQSVPGRVPRLLKRHGTNSRP